MRMQEDVPHSFPLIIGEGKIRSPVIHDVVIPDPTFVIGTIPTWREIAGSIGMGVRAIITGLAIVR